ncbi:MAG: tetratricopeptide repeat protein [Planctomycetota bacterium]
MNASVTNRFAQPIAILVITLTGVLAYANTLQAPFIFDDIPNISENANVHVEEIGIGPLWRASVQSPLKGRPIAYLTFAINYAISGLEVWSYHATNIGIHILAGITAYWLSLLLLRQASQKNDRILIWLSANGITFASLFAGLLFTLHPLQTQSVTYVVQRMTSLAALFYLAAFAFYLVGRKSTVRWKRWCGWTLAIVLWMLSLGCKQISVTLPIVILLYEWYFEDDLSLAWFRERLAGVVAVALVLITVSVVHIILVGSVFIHFESRDFTMFERLLTQTRVLCIYARLTLLPIPSQMNLLHDVTVSKGLLDPPTTAIALFAVLMYLAIAIGAVRWSKLASFCLLWPVIHLAIESSILPIELIYEHRMYLPLFGVTLLSGIGIASVLPRSKPWLAWGTALGIAALLGGLTYSRNETWRDPIRLWSDVAAKSPAVPRAYLNRGGAYAAIHEWDLAIADFSHAIQLRPEGTSFIGRGMVLRETGRMQEAMSDFSAAASNAETAEIEAIALRNRGTTWSALGDDRRAIEDYSRAIEKWPDDINSRFNRANAYRRRGDFRLAMADYRECLRLNPNYVQAVNNIAALYAECPDPNLRNPRLSLQFALRACELTNYGDWQILDTLASSYAANGDFRSASRWQSTALQLAPERFKNDLRARLELYMARSKSP